uniref:Uncharacterized protein n=1 Tax=Poecilia reticulata TaxID=8081 RepID=A0A3P9P3U2_POERE
MYRSHPQLIHNTKLEMKIDFYVPQKICGYQKTAEDKTCPHNVLNNFCQIEWADIFNSRDGLKLKASHSQFKTSSLTKY